MSGTIKNVRLQVVTVLTSAVAILAVLSQVSAELLEAVMSWDGELVNAVALIPAVIAIIRRVTPVAKEDRGIS